MTQVSPEALFTDPAERARITAEARFGEAEIAPMLAALPQGARVLEIGCGTGFLLARLAQQRPDIGFVGLEPIGPGFAGFADTLARIKAAFPNIAIHHDRVEVANAATLGRFDLVFSVNVFEHVDDWRVATDRAVDLLVPTGRVVILCPNYAVPYESHFRIPLVFGPRLTRRLFARHIARVEADEGAEGLWGSLNFISVPQMRRHCRTRGHGVGFDGSILSKMLARLDTDPEFARRQARIATLARLLRRAKVFRLMEALPADFSPYMKAVLTRGTAGSR